MQCVLGTVKDSDYWENGTEIVQMRLVLWSEMQRKCKKEKKCDEIDEFSSKDSQIRCKNCAM